MFRFIPITGAKQKLEEEKLLENWTLVSTTLKLNAIETHHVLYSNLNYHNYPHFINFVCG